MSSSSFGALTCTSVHASQRLSPKNSAYRENHVRQQMAKSIPQLFEVLIEIEAGDLRGPTSTSVYIGLDFAAGR